LSKANRSGDQAVDLAQRSQLREAAAQVLLQQAMGNAVFKNCGPVRELTAKALEVSRDQSSLNQAANAFAACGDTMQTQSLIDELQKGFPIDTLLNTVSIPLMRAQLELNRGNAAQAVQLLEPARKYEVYGDFWPQYLRGQAYLKQGNGAQAAIEFQTILDHRGWYPTSPLYPLAHLGLARAAALSGDSGKARKSYQDFFAIWKDADQTIPFLVEAQREYEKLK
jgi:predicted Zn-dependent protease